MNGFMKNWKTVLKITWNKSEQNKKERKKKYLRTNLVFSVFPAPDSPETMMDWLIFKTFMSL